MRLNKIILLLLCFITLISCQSKDPIEVWKTELIQMKSETIDMIDSLTDRSQYLYLYENRKALLIDSLANGTVGKTETTWEIHQRNGKEIFLLGYGQESEGIQGIAYPIVVKNENEFKMAFDSLNEHHRWNLKFVSLKDTLKLQL